MQARNISAVECMHTLMSRNTTLQQRDVSIDALRAAADASGHGVAILDAAALTSTRCGCSFDGCHFPGLLDTFSRQFLAVLAR